MESNRKLIIVNGKIVGTFLAYKCKKTGMSLVGMADFKEDGSTFFRKMTAEMAQERLNELPEGSVQQSRMVVAVSCSNSTGKITINLTHNLVPAWCETVVLDKNGTWENTIKSWYEVWRVVRQRENRETWLDNYGDLYCPTFVA